MLGCQPGLLNRQGYGQRLPEGGALAGELLFCACLPTKGYWLCSFRTEFAVLGLIGRSSSSQQVCVVFIAVIELL
jgi:hypothetical protein